MYNTYKAWVYDYKILFFVLFSIFGGQISWCLHFSCFPLHRAYVLHKYGKLTMTSDDGAVSLECMERSSKQMEIARMGDMFHQLNRICFRNGMKECGCSRLRV